MSSHDAWLNVLTGISQGSFDKIYLRDASGNMVDLLTLLAYIERFTKGSLGNIVENLKQGFRLIKPVM